ncbi:hypothetical protein ACFVYF_19005 [Streptomyces sp. NPDC058274]|uniref:hypothetical protein n=1 Tax=Streptomyces sp. NPDC058274 TaxID=3346416 RepID=UPI0036E010B5
MTEERDEASVDSLPIDVETISATIDLAWHMDISTSTREDIDARTGELIGHINLLRGQPLGEDENPDRLRLLRIVDRHLAPMDRPTARTPAFEAFHFMHDTLVFAKALLSAYEMTNKKS